jgi:hypothetical protein
MERVMENHDIEEPNRSEQWPRTPCPGCGALDVGDCQCELEPLVLHGEADPEETLTERWSKGPAARALGLPESE